MTVLKLPNVFKKTECPNAEMFVKDSDVVLMLNANLKTMLHSALAEVDTMETQKIESTGANLSQHLVKPTLNAHRTHTVTV
jgi:hypothetical protein